MSDSIKSMHDDFDVFESWCKENKKECSWNDFIESKGNFKIYQLEKNEKSQKEQKIWKEKRLREIGVLPEDWIDNYNLGHKWDGCKECENSKTIHRMVKENRYEKEYKDKWGSYYHEYEIGCPKCGHISYYCAQHLRVDTFIK